MLLLLVVHSASVSRAAKPEGWGVYVDSNGGRHPWRITQSSTLMWEGKPYLPVGGMFNSSYIFWARHPNPPPRNPESEFALTCRRLDFLRHYGIDDLYLHYCGPDVPSPIVQRVIDAFEARGFHYGIEPTSTPETKCPGFVLRPEFDVKPVSGAAHIELDLKKAKLDASGTVRVLWCARDEKEPLAAGVVEAKVGEDNILRADIPVPPRATSVHYSPEVLLSTADPVSMFAGYADYAKKLTAWLRSIRFGPGFRFVVDPFRNEEPMSSDTMPTHPEFVAGLDHWLRARYSSAEALRQAWGVADRQLSFSTAARLVPLAPDALVSQDGRLVSVPAHSRYFTDVGEYRAHVAETFNSRIADAIKTVDDVPVIFKHNVRYKRMFSNDRTGGGFDGIGWEPYGDGASLVVHNGGVCEAEIANSNRTMWSVVTETSPAAFEKQKKEIGYVTRERMYDDFDTLVRAGAKGIFVFGFTFDPPGGFMTSEVIRDPRELAWMAEYKRILNASADQLAAYKPVYAYCFPADLEFAREQGGAEYAIDGHIGPDKILPLPTGSWILPAERTDIDTPLMIRTTSRSDLVRQSLDVHDRRLRWPTLSEFRRKVLGYSFLPAEKPATGRLAWWKHKMVATWPELPLPQRETGGNAAIGYGFYYDTFDQKTTWTAMPSDLQSVEPLSQAHHSPLWIEGENAAKTNFNIPREDGYPQFSNGLALSVFCVGYAPPAPFYAKYDFTVPKQGRYVLWVRERTLERMSPCRFRFGNGTWTDVSPDTPAVDPVRLDWWSSIFAGNELGWYRYGEVTLPPEKAELTIQVLPDAKERYEKHIDALRLETVAPGAP